MKLGLLQALHSRHLLSMVSYCLHLPTIPTVSVSSLLRGATPWLDDNLLVSFGTGMLLRSFAGVANFAGCFAHSPEITVIARAGYVNWCCVHVCGYIRKSKNLCISISTYSSVYVCMATHITSTQGTSPAWITHSQYRSKRSVHTVYSQVVSETTCS